MLKTSPHSLRPGQSFLHKMDPRSKALCLLILSPAIFQAEFVDLFALSALFLFLLNRIHFPIMEMLSKIKPFLILILFVFMARACFTPGDMLIGNSYIQITQEGARHGGLSAWRLFSVIILGIIFSSTTKISEIKSVVEWFLRPIPFVPEQKAAMMISLVFRFVPVIFEKANEISAAQRARCVENRKNPLYRIQKIAIPLILRTFSHADKLTEAMEARLYSENRSSRHFSKLSKKDFLAPLAVLCMAALMALL